MSVRRALRIGTVSGYLGDRFTAVDEAMAGDPVDGTARGGPRRDRRRAGGTRAGRGRRLRRPLDGGSRARHPPARRQPARHAGPHAGGPLADGQLDRSTIVCPLHLRAFSFVDGPCAEGGRITTHTVRDEDGQVVIDL